jgi:hypothetical protein
MSGYFSSSGSQQRCSGTTYKWRRWWLIGKDDIRDLGRQPRSAFIIWMNALVVHEAQIIGIGIANRVDDHILGIMIIDKLCNQLRSRVELWQH